MEPNKPTHQIMYERHKMVSLIVTIVVFVSVLLSFSFAFFSPTKIVQIGSDEYNNLPTTTFKRKVNVTHIVPFYSFFDVYLVLKKENPTTEEISTSSHVYSADNKLVMEKQNTFNASCSSGYCERVLVVSVSPLRESGLNIDVSITTQSKFSTLSFVIQYKSFWYIFFVNLVHLCTMSLDIFGIVFLLFNWRGVPMKEWYFEHIYLVIVLFFAVLFDSTYPFLYLYESAYILWVLQTLQSLFLFTLFLYYIILLICMSFKYSPNKGAILLAIGVGLGQFCCMISVLLLNNIENMKSFTELNQPIEVYVLVCALALTNVLYCFVSCFYTYWILRHNKEVKQFAVHTMFTITIGLIVGLTTYDYYYLTIVPFVDFNLTTTLSCVVMLVGMYVITFGSYKTTENKYKQVETEIPFDENHEVVIYDRKSLELARTIEERTENPQQKLDPTSVQRIDDDEPMNNDDNQNPLSDMAITL